MNRRGFLKGLGAMVAGIALDQAIPLGRVWSFPKVIKPLNIRSFSCIWWDQAALENFKANTQFVVAGETRPWPAYTGRKLQFYGCKPMVAEISEFADVIEISGRLPRRADG